MDYGLWSKLVEKGKEIILTINRERENAFEPMIQIPGAQPLNPL